MSFFLALFLLFKLATKQILIGPLNIAIEFVFWILIGIYFGPVKGAFLSILLDTVYQLFFGNIAFWLIEYAIVPPLSSIVSWALFNIFKNKAKIKLMFSNVILIAVLISSLTIIFILLNEIGFRWESKFLDPMVAYIFIASFSALILLILISVNVVYFINKNTALVDFIHAFSIVVIVIILFRWLWGPYAYVIYAKRFWSPNMNMIEKYPIILSGIVLKSFLTIPVYSIIIIPLIRIHTIHINRNVNYGYQ